MTSFLFFKQVLFDFDKRFPGKGINIFELNISTLSEHVISVTKKKYTFAETGNQTELSTSTNESKFDFNKPIEFLTAVNPLLEDNRKCLMLLIKFYLLDDYKNKATCTLIFRYTIYSITMLFSAFN